MDMTSCCRADEQLRSRVSSLMLGLMAVMVVSFGWVLTAQRERANAAEYAAQMAGRRAELIVASDTDAVLMCNESGMIATANPAAAKMFGWEQNAMVGHYVSELLPPDMRAEHKKELQTAVDELNGIHEDWIVQRTDLPTTGLSKDKGHVPILLTVRAIKYGGKIEFVTSMRPKDYRTTRISEPLRDPLQLIRRN